MRLYVHRATLRGMEAVRHEIIKQCKKSCATKIQRKQAAEEWARAIIESMDKAKIPTPLAITALELAQYVLLQDLR